MVDIEGGAVSSVSYESTQPFQKQLDELSVSLNEHSTLCDLLQQVYILIDIYIYIYIYFTTLITNKYKHQIKGKRDTIKTRVRERHGNSWRSNWVRTGKKQLLIMY